MPEGACCGYRGPARRRRGQTGRRPRALAKWPMPIAAERRKSIAGRRPGRSAVRSLPRSSLKGTGMTVEEKKPTGDALELTVDDQGVVAEVLLPEDRPPIRVLGHVPEVHAPGLDAVVGLCPQVESPADPVGIQNERADVHLAVVGRGRPALEADVGGPGIRPGAAVDGHRDLAHGD